MNWGKFGTTIGGYLLGAIIGSLIPGVGTMLGAMIGGVIGGVVGSLVFPDDPIRIEGQRLQTLVQTSTYGWAIPILFGHVRVGGCVVWAGDRIEHRVEEGEGGKGGGGSDVVYTRYYYTQSFAVKICKGPVAELFRIWADNKLIYDCKPENDGPVVGQGLRFNFYYGTEDQDPDPVYESYEGAGNVPAFRGDCYIVFEDLNITDYGGRIPNMNFEVASDSEISYAQTSIDIGGMLGGVGSPPTQMCLSDTNEFCVLRYEDHWIVIDVINNEIITSTEDGDAISCNFDVKGSFIYGITANGGDRRPYIMDRYLNVLRTADDPGFATKLGTVVAPPGSAALTTSGGILWACSSPGSRDGYVFVYNAATLEEWTHWSVRYVAGIDTWCHLVSHICVDYETNYAYVLVQLTTGAGVLTGKTYLVEFLPAPGSLPRIFTITGTGSAYIANILGYDPVSRRLFLSDDCPVGVQAAKSNNGIIWVWDIESESVIERFGPPYDGHSYKLSYANLSQINNGLLWVFRDGTDFVAINTSTLEIVQEHAKSNWDCPVINDDSNFIYEPICNAIWPMPGRGAVDEFIKLLINRSTRELIPLDDIITDICALVDFESSDLDLSDVESDRVRGYLVDKQMTARKALEPLQQAFYWDCAEIDGKITAVKRGGDSVVTITEDDLAVTEEGQDRPDELPIARVQQVELPRVLNISYIDYEQAYQPGTQRSIRQVTDSVGEYTITFPLVLTASEAKQIAETLHYVAWLERNAYAPIYLPPKYAYLTVTDVITITRGNNSYLLHIQKIDFGANNLLKIDAIPEDAAVYDSEAIGSGGEHEPEEEIDYPGTTDFYLIDAPYIRDNENFLTPYGYYLAANGRRAAWRGAQLFESQDGGVSYQIIQTMVTGAVIGVATTALGDVSDPWVWDKHTFTIKLIDEEQELESTSETNQLNGANVFLLGNPSTGWELCSFRNATLNADGTYTLDTLLRGLRGTEWMCNAHSVGDIFILLSTSTIYRVDAQSADLDVERLYKAISLGMAFSTGMVTNFTNTGRGLRPYAPMHIRGERDGSNNLTITWVRRSRIDGAWRDKVDVSLGETSEEYEVDIVKAGSVVRTFDSLASETCTYTAAQQTTDGFTPGDPIPVRVYQISAAVDRGFRGDETV